MDLINNTNNDSWFDLLLTVLFIGETDSIRNVQRYKSHRRSLPLPSTWRGKIGNTVQSIHHQQLLLLISPASPTYQRSPIPGNPSPYRIYLPLGRISEPISVPSVGLP
ncbi:hypothetical protein ONS95_001545 [Cadophora gregata]|uniref:uncharacterized protein n=1 Tax=Cadophora gregata TaxID=51156 RepID=UPI0026DBEC65|nr:uncharacterized protein ONS95_001545 [Cadophora gregata]KAK0111168.1 hypothetical protein ONS95_001545 [Cadophora gregata]